VALIYNSTTTEYSSKTVSYGGVTTVWIEETKPTTTFRKEITASHSKGWGASAWGSSPWGGASRERTSFTEETKPTTSYTEES